MTGISHQATVVTPKTLQVPHSFLPEAPRSVVRWGLLKLQHSARTRSTCSGMSSRDSAKYVPGLYPVGTAKFIPGPHPLGMDPHTHTRIRVPIPVQSIKGMWNSCFQVPEIFAFG